MSGFKAGVPNGGVTGDSNYFTPNQQFPGGKSGGSQFWSRGWGASEETQNGGAKQRGMSGGKGAYGSKHKCMGCGG